MDDSSLTKEKIIQLIKNDDASLTFVKPKTSSSAAWSSFSYIFISNRKKDFVCCDKCKDVLHHKSESGTSNMIKHIKSCQTTSKAIPNASLTIKEYLRPKTVQPIPKIFKEKITNATAEFVALDNRAFGLVSGDGFINLAQTIFNVGQNLSKTPDVNVLDLIPNPRTVSVSFCGIALFHLNDQLKLHVFILGCFPYDRDNQTASQIRQFVDSKLMEFNLTLDNSKFVVCDNENKMKSAFKDSCTRIGCSIHYINKQLEHCFTTDVIDKVPVKCEIVQQMFVHVRKIVTHTRRTHKQAKLSRKLQSYCDTRFNGAFLTMHVFLLVFDELPGVLERALMNDYESIDKDLLSSICLFLKPFEEVIEQFSSDTKPTIYKVLPFKQYLLSHCKIHPDDHDGIQQVKIFLEKRIQDVLILHDVHYITTFLHPSFKNFDKCPDLRAKAIDLTKNELMKRQPSSSIICSTNNKSPVRIAQLDPQTSSPKTLLSQCFDTSKNDLKLSTTPYDELEEYMAFNVRLSENDDILLFWLNHKMKFPTLFNIIQDFYAIPASNTTIERLFSSSKNTITDKRTRLGTEKINKLLFLQKNLNLLKEIAKQPVNEAAVTVTKRKMVLQSSCTSLYDNQEELITITSTKKLKLNEKDDIIFCEDDEENDVEFF
ncbi:unnamed protein product [Rotaria sp. Silwood2]|nr:unnamed protein product [Rotaria sp. Silwood2]CAF2697607.1 unnamed protein product [Rotaria sp. Silwood2]CAF3119587.1 unnamed protein product [Rotaria sp. Silwood2]CAF4430603.1 unnamed protein product [Rotaria sp. Silwood2]CAF4451575.1 unnamed protein product [Rotaria sp. Silwood2]